jgi:hypothetical protein
MPKGSAATMPGQPFSDDFERAELGPHYTKRGGTWRIISGKLATLGEHNLPLWCNVPLGTNAKIEFTTTSHSDAVDTKVEVFGDGERFESGYSVIIGGWHNQITTIARLDEHEAHRAQIRRSWEKDRTYHWTVQRKDGHTVELYIDGEKILEYDDKDPLVGAKNDKMAFNSWESEVDYDDLKITPLP